jgi:hypothetical protein
MFVADMQPTTWSVDNIPMLVMNGCAAVDNVPVSVIALIVALELMFPATSSLYAGLVEPIPTFPAEVTLMRSWRSLDPVHTDTPSYPFSDSPSAKVSELWS